MAAYLAARDQPNLALFRRWFAEADDGLPAKVERIFRNLARSARHPKWKGCGFLRTSAELANMPGHPAMKIGAAHKKKFEDWLRATFDAAGIAQAAQLARQILLLLDGSFAVVLLHRDPSYMETAGEAAHALIAAALPVRAKTAGAIVCRHCERSETFKTRRAFAMHLEHRVADSARWRRIARANSSVGVTMSGTMIVIAPAAIAAATPWLESSTATQTSGFRPKRAAANR